jgi:hypothetical protein
MVLLQHEKDTVDYFLAGKMPMVVDRFFHFCLEFGSEHLVGLAGAGFSQRNGYGTLGNACMDYSDSWLVLCLFMTGLNLHHAGVSLNGVFPEVPVRFFP